MIQENGGEFTVSSEEGKGAKFRVVFPQSMKAVYNE
jgi:chemotaxis protein histidine kinase CheA